MDKLFKDDRCYRPDEIAKTWAVHVSTIYRLINNVDNQLSSFLLVKKIRIWGRDANVYMEKNKVKPEA